MSHDLARWGRSRAWLGAAALAAALAAPAAARAGDLLDARIDFPFADDNVLRDAGEDRQSSPDASFTPPSGLDFDTFLHLGLYKALDLGGGFVPEAAIYLKLDVANSGTIRDDTSYIRLNYFLDPDVRERSWFLELIPIDADRERLGFHREISWGGTNVFPKNFRGSLAPAAKTGLDFTTWYLYVGAKTALVRSAADLELENEEGNTTLFVERTFYGGFAGFGVELGLPGLWVEANGGYFRKGTNNKAEVLGKPIHAAGVSGQLSYATGVPISRRIDLGLYRQDPVRFDVTAPTLEGSGVSARVAGEFTWVMQTLADLDNPGSTENEASMAAFLSAAIQVDAARIHLDVGMRELTFITYDVPGFIPNAALPNGAQTKPEIAGTLAFDYTVREVGLTPFVQVSGQRPAVYEGVVPAGSNVPESLQGTQRVVVRGSDPGDWDILPEGEAELPVWEAKVGLRWSYAEMFSLLGEVTYGYDPNRSQLRKDAFGIARREFIQAERLGFGVLASMRF